MSYKKGNSGTVQDWATRCARKIWDEVDNKDVTVPHLAAIITVFAEPLLQLLAPREHYHCNDSWYCCGKCVNPDHGSGFLDDEWPLDSHDGESARISGVCNCGADEWNKKLEKALDRVEETQPLREQK